eukprot:330690-Chlamydomonas_euryale.AAC.3
MQDLVNMVSEVGDLAAALHDAVSVGGRGGKEGRGFGVGGRGDEGMRGESGTSRLFSRNGE